MPYQLFVVIEYYIGQKAQSASIGKPDKELSLQNRDSITQSLI